MDIKTALQRYWGYANFRPLQEDIITSVLDGKDTLALLPTGGGKSLCFQVPAMVLDGVCVVISPLIALMKDQVENLKKRKIPAAAIYTGMHNREVEITLRRSLAGEIKFLYVSPERLKNELFKNTLREMKVCLIAVDEAHCISQWGYDFRPSYLQISEIRKMCPNIPILALTATATPEVVTDIQEKLSFKEKNLFQKSFVRTNLTYFVMKEENKMKRLLTIMKKTPGSGIVYVRNRKKTQEIAALLKENGFSADFYHAGVPVGMREHKQDSWTRGRTRVMVSTNAFGMGIDKPDVRFVVHLDLPDNLEAYFQEAGRGGRDEKRSYAVLLYEDADIQNLIQNFNVTYPPLETIRNVYQLLGNYYQVPIGNGEGCSFEFDNKNFANTYKLNPLITYNALKFIEKEGFILFTDTYKSSSKVNIPILRDKLYRFQVENEYYDSLIKMLLRSYTGLFTDFVNINENEIAQRAGVSVEEIVEALNKLHQFEIIIYQQKTENPRLVFLENRLESKYLVLSNDIYKERIEDAKKRLDAVIKYATTITKCRSQQLVAYFGETESIRCGKCDVCLGRNKMVLSELAFNAVLNKIKPILQEDALSLEELLEKVDCNENEMLIVIRWLLDNEKITYVDAKKIKWNDL